MDLKALDLNKYNIYPSYHVGQENSIRELLTLFSKIKNEEIDSKIGELASPTGSGKTIINRAVGMALLDLYPELIKQVVYTTPQRDLVRQIAEEDALKIPTVMGRSNYICSTNKDLDASSCPYRTARTMRLKPDTCRDCEYVKRKYAFKNAKIGACTLDFLLYNHIQPDVLIIDESTKAEEKLLNHFGIKLPACVDIDNLIPSLHDWLLDLQGEQMDYEDQLDAVVMRNGNTQSRRYTQEILDITKKINRVTRTIGKCTRVLQVAQDPDDFIIDKDRNFKLIRGGYPFNGLIKSAKFVIMSSGTPTTSLLTSKFTRIDAIHPIPKDRRLIYYTPVGKMSRAHQEKTIPLMTKRIIEIHQEYPKKTLVHAHSYPLAEKLYKSILQQKPSLKPYLLLQESSLRAEALSRFKSCKTQMIWISVYYDEGLNLPGVDYQRNIIAKIPYPSLGDEWVLKRQKVDIKDFGLDICYRMSTIVDIQQAASRCTRGPTDFSKAFILDANFGYFYSQNKSLFEPWFKEALVWETKEERELRKKNEKRLA